MVDSTVVSRKRRAERLQIQSYEPEVIEWELFIDILKETCEIHLCEEAYSTSLSLIFDIKDIISLTDKNKSSDLSSVESKGSSLSTIEPNNTFALNYFKNKYPFKFVISEELAVILATFCVKIHKDIKFSMCHLVKFYDNKILIFYERMIFDLYIENPSKHKSFIDLIYDSQYGFVQYFATTDVDKVNLIPFNFICNYITEKNIVSRKNIDSQKVLILEIIEDYKKDIS